MLIPNFILNQLSIRDPKQITTIVIHHSVFDPTADIATLAQFEKNSQGFLTIGYNAYCKLADKASDKWVMEQGRPINRIPAAQYGMNTEGYAICIGGNYHPGGASFVTPVSKNALDVVAAQIHAVREHTPTVKYLMGHRDVATIKAKKGLNPGDYSTACPGDNLYKMLHDLRVMTGLAQYPGL